MLPWQLLPWHVDLATSGGYDFGTDDPTYLGPIVQAQNYQSARVRALTIECRARLMLLIINLVKDSGFPLGTACVSRSLSC